jgi:hypothetical protein
VSDLGQARQKVHMYGTFISGLQQFFAHILNAKDNNNHYEAYGSVFVFPVAWGDLALLVSCLEMSFFK